MAGGGFEARFEGVGVLGGKDGKEKGGMGWDISDFLHACVKIVELSFGVCRYEMT